LSIEQKTQPTSAKLPMCPALELPAGSAFAACMHGLAAYRNFRSSQTTKRARYHLASATIAASSLLASAFTSGAAAEGGAAMAGVGAAMTASAACSPASFTDGVLALQVAAVDHVADQLKSQA
jgi:hypothetical protein